MTSRFHGEPKVSPCVIFVQEQKYKKIDQWDQFLLKTAVKKYYIGLSEDHMTKYVITGSNYFEYESKYKEAISLAYPWIGINQNGFAAVKCPTVSGTVDAA